jgi:hypothetical protein
MVRRYKESVAFIGPAVTDWYNFNAKSQENTYEDDPIQLAGDIIGWTPFLIPLLIYLVNVL